MVEYNNLKSNLLFVDDVPLGVAGGVEVIDVAVFPPFLFDSLVLLQIGIPLLQIQL